MIGFTEICVCFAICLIILGITALLGDLIDGCNGDCETGGWMFSTIGFGICLTILLYQNGILK